MVDKLERRPVLLTTPSTCRMPKFLSPEFGTKFQREVPLFWSYLNFSILLIMGVRTGLNCIRWASFILVIKPRRMRLIAAYVPWSLCVCV